jgi:hypothetical protein
VPKSLGSRKVRYGDSMRYLAHLLIVNGLGTLLVAAPASAQSVCRPADEASALLIKEMGRYSSATNGDDRVVRDSLRLPSVPASELALVTSESVCKKANATYQTTLGGLGGTPFSGRVYVVKIGAAYAVLDPALKFGDPDNWVVEIQDSKFKKLSLY